MSEHGTHGDLEDALGRIQARTLELCASDGLGGLPKGLVELARGVYLQASETNVRSVTKERLIAFAEEVQRLFPRA